jgi:hypothetical protein
MPYYGLTFCRGGEGNRRAMACLRGARRDHVRSEAGDELRVETTLCDQVRIGDLARGD